MKIIKYRFRLKKDYEAYVAKQKRIAEDKRNAEILAKEKTISDGINEVNFLRTHKRKSYSYKAGDNSKGGFYDMSGYAYQYWKKLIDNRGGSKVPILKAQDTLVTHGVAPSSELEYIGSTITYENYVLVTETWANINVTIIRNGKGTLYLDGCSITGNWINDELDMYSIASKNGLSGYWVNHEKIYKKAGGISFVDFYKCNNWVYLGNDKNQIDANFELALLEAKKQIQKRSQEIKDDIKEEMDYINTNNATILSKVKSEKIVSNYGSYSRYEVSFTDGKSGQLDYYPEDGRWCTFSWLLVDTNDKCYTVKGKALCQLYWDLTH